MSYAPTTDFLALLRQTASGVSVARMPGLDYVVAALSRAGLFQLSIGQTPPTTNQSTTVWLKPSLPSWVAEGTVYIWNAGAAQYQTATSTLWNALLAPSASAYSFQSAGQATNVVNAGTSLVAVQRAAPGATALVLPNMAAQFLTGRPLKIVDWSSAVTNHLITLTPPDGTTIMQQASWRLLSTAAQLSGIVLHPSPDLNGWVIAP